MADSIANLSIKLGADAAGLSAGLNQAQTKVQTFAATVTGMLSPVGGLLGAAGLGVGAFKAGAFLSDSIKEATSFVDAMQRVANITGSTKEEYDALKTAAKSLPTVGPAEAARAMAKLAEAGMKAEEILGSLAPTLKIAKMGHMELGEAVDFVDSTLDGMGMTTKETTKLADMMAVAIKKTSLHNIKGTFAEALPAARQAGRSIEEVTAAMMALADVGIEGGAAGAGLKKFFTKTGALSGDAKLVLDKMNVKFTDETPLDEIVDKFNEKLAGMSMTERKITLSPIVDAKGITAFLGLLDAGGEKIREYKKQLEESAGAAAKFRNEFGESFSEVTKRYDAAAERLKISAGELFLPVISKGAEAAAESMDLLNKSIERLKGNSAPVADSSAKWMEFGIRSTHMFGVFLRNVGTLGFGTKNQAQELQDKLAAAGLVGFDAEKLNLDAAAGDASKKMGGLTGAPMAWHDAIDGANKKSEEFNLDLLKLNQRLEEQSQAFGRTSREAELWKLKLNGIDEASDAFKRVAEKSASLDLRDKILNETKYVGDALDQARQKVEALWDAFGDEEAMHGSEALQSGLRQMEKEMDRIRNEQTVSLKNELQTPLEKFTGRMDELEKLNLDADLLMRAQAKAMEDFESSMPKATYTPTGAHKVGSAEANATIARAWNQGINSSSSSNDPMAIAKQSLKKTEEQAKLAQEANKLLKDVIKEVRNNKHGVIPNFMR